MPSDIVNARALLMLGDTVTTDHISPAGAIPTDYPAGKHLLSLSVPKQEFNSYGSRRGNHEVMMRGAFANIRIKNKLVDPAEGSFTRKFPAGDILHVYDAAMEYEKENTTLLVIGGSEYGTGSSRDWAAKGTLLLGIKAVLACSFERIHRSNLVGMGILPLVFKEGESSASLGLQGDEIYSIAGIANIYPGKILPVQAEANDGRVITFEVHAWFNTAIEVEYFFHGGILPYVLRKLKDS
jgi:aconitate hydratase